MRDTTFLTVMAALLVVTLEGFLGVIGMRAFEQIALIRHMESLGNVNQTGSKVLYKSDDTKERVLKSTKS